MRPQITLEAFVEFCERKPAHEEYDFTDARNCAVAQFLKSVGVQNYVLLSQEIPAPFSDPVCFRPWSFGALADRLRAAIAKAEGR